ncbi:MAG: 4-aminobutyrate--2-oxoglutarate transaminase [Deltaproteobacteria bacterium]|nr:4-aminobutyrate--2-oxoglutarate transaminase [Deltaproteobacteria bacterium]
MSYVKLTTPIPGPRSQALVERRKRWVAQGVSLAHPVCVESASGATLTDVDGNVFLDFCGGIGCLNVGHTHPEVVRAAKEQLDRVTHACFQVTTYESYVEVAEALCRLAPGAFDKRAALFSTGAECTENAVKIARRATGRNGVLCFEHAFHGRTLLGMTMTSKATPYKVGMGPFAPEVYRVPYPYPYRDSSIVGRLEKSLGTIVSPSDLAAIIIEPVLGEGGFVVPPREFFAELRAFCDKHGVVFISDEVQSGMGRTGRMFASEALGFTPDLTTVAKSIAGGLPLSGVVGRSSIMDSVPPGGIGGTFAGNPVSCAAAVASIRALEAELASGRAERVGQKARAFLEGLAQEKNLIGEVRGLGPMLAVELVRDRGTKEPADMETKEIIARARGKGLLLLSAGSLGNVLRLLFPITIPDDALEEGLSILASSFP